MAGSPLKVVPAGSMKAEDKTPGVRSRNLAFSARVMMFETEIDGGSQRPPHAHPHDQICYVVKGEIEVVVGNDRQVCHPGDSFAIPGGVMHSIGARTDALIVDAFNQVAAQAKDGGKA